MQSRNIENFKGLSQFTDITDFNNSIEQWMLDVKGKFTKSELIALKRLIRFSAKVVGVCNAKVGTIVSATHEKDGAGISRSTFKRMITKAIRLGLLSVHNTVRKNGSKSSNIYVFNSFYTCSEPSKEEKLNQPQTCSLSKTNNINNNKRNMNFSADQLLKNSESKSQKLDASFTSERVPVQFTNFVKNFYNDAKRIEEYWKLVKISAFKNNIAGNVTDIAIQSFKALVRKIKLSKVFNTHGFYYGILNNKFRAKYWVDLFNEVWDTCDVGASIILCKWPYPF